MDFGTESARAVLVDCADGTEVGHRRLRVQQRRDRRAAAGAGRGRRARAGLGASGSGDYIRAFRETIPALLAETGIDPAQVVGVGIDFTACTMLPTLADGTPLCELPELRREPHAWVKLWKHHAAQPEADLINQVAAERGEPWLERYGGKISSEWFFAKALQILREAPEVYARAERLIEAADWVVWQLTGVETRSSCTAGYKAMWSKADGFPPDDYFAALDPAFARVVDEKMSRADRPARQPRRRARPSARRRGPGCAPGRRSRSRTSTRTSSAPAVRVTEPGNARDDHGHEHLPHPARRRSPRSSRGCAGWSRTASCPGLFGFEAGQSAVGDIFAWFAETGDDAARGARAARPAKLRPGQSGLLALDWWNGNRSVLVDADLRGLLVGMTLATKPAEIYRALIEATAFGTRVIVEAFESGGVAVDSVVACGGLPERNKLLMQIYADVLGREIAVGASTQAPALGAAMFAAVAGRRVRARSPRPRGT